MAYPYITEFKSPRWALFSQIKRVPDYYIPFQSELERKTRELEQYLLRQQTNISLETIYWYCILKKYTYSEMRDDLRQKISGVIDEGCVESVDELGFLQKKGPQVTTPNITETFYALSALHLLDKLPDYLQTNPEFNRREKIIKFVMNRNQKGSFVHCFDKHCQKCKDKEYSYITQLQAFGILDLVDYDLRTLDARQIELIFKRIRRDERRYPLKLLIYRYLGKQGEINDSDIKALFDCQKRDGGFNFASSTVKGGIEDTYWITSALEAYKWLGDYPKGKIYSFLANFIKSHVSDNTFRSEAELRETAMVLILLSYVWGSLIEEIEGTIFEKLSKSSTIDFDKFVEEVEIQGAEEEVIAYINSKYQFKLEIEENAVKFSNYLRGLERTNALFTKMIYERVKVRSMVDLTELMSVYNHNRPRKDRVYIELIQDVVEKLIQNNFVTGKVEKKKRGFATRHVFQVSGRVARVLSISVPLLFDQIEREKGQVREFERDIENMTMEIQKSAQNIFREVESLILVDEIPLARQRLTSLIKNSLFDAEFFNKNVEKFQKEFTYLDAKNLLKDKVSRWEIVFGDLRRNFKNVEDALLKRIEIREGAIKDKETIEDLERKIQTKVADFSEQIGDFKEKAYQLLKNPVDHAGVQNLVDLIQGIHSSLKQVDDKFAIVSKEINPIEELLKDERKDAVNYWLSKRDELNGKIKEIRGTFEVWQGTHKTIVAKKKEIIELVTNFKENIKKEFKSLSPKQAADTLDRELNKILEYLSTESKNLTKNLDSENDRLKLFPGLRQNLEREWSETQQFVETNLNKVRGEILAQIEVARELQMQDEFSQSVDNEIQKLQEFITEGRNRLHVLLDMGKTIQIDQYYGIINEIDRVWKEKSQVINDRIEKNKQSYPNFEKNCQISIYKFQTFGKFFEQEFQQLNDQVLTDVIKQEAITTADMSENNVVDIAELAKKLNLNKKELRNRIQNMLSDSIIEGKMLETCQAFVKTEIWAKIDKIKEFIQQKLTIIIEAKNQTLRLYKTALENHALSKTREEIRRRITVFDSLITESRMYLNQYVDRLSIPPQNKSYQKEDALFEAEIQKAKQELESILKNIDKLDKLQTFMDEKLDFLKTIITSQMELLEDKIIQEKSIKKVADDFEGDIANLRRNINTVERDVQTYCKNVWHTKTAKDVEPILLDLKQDFYEQKSKIIDKFESSQEAIKDRIYNRQNAIFKGKFEKVIEDKQENLNNVLGKIQRDIERKIITRDFKGASETLTRRVAVFNKSIEDDSKEIKDEANKISKTIKGFPMKNKYLLDKWKLFKQEIALVVKEKVTTLETEIIENYIKLTIKVFKDEYVTFSLLAMELKMPKDIIKERLITLIGEGKLPGKIYLELEIYYEKPDALDKIDRESVEVIKATSVRTYLFWNRLSRFAKQYGSIFALFAAVITSSFTIYRFYENPLILIFPFTAVAIILLYNAFKKSGKAKDYETVSEPKEKE